MTFTGETVRGPPLPPPPHCVNTTRHCYYTPDRQT
jgi:hypothetical protein